MLDFSIAVAYTNYIQVTTHLGSFPRGKHQTGFFR